MLHAATEAGLDFLGVTDHNNVAHHAAYGPGGNGRPIVIPGVEVTTYGGHWNAWGTDRWWEFRTPEAPAVERAMAEAAAAGAFVSVNHPKPFGPPWEYETVRSMRAIEVWNGAWAGLNSVSLAMWEARLRDGQRLVAVGGSDTHDLRSGDPDARHATLGHPTTWVNAGRDADARAILDAMRAGRRRSRRDHGRPRRSRRHRRGGSALGRLVGGGRCAAGQHLRAGAARRLERRAAGAHQPDLVVDCGLTEGRPPLCVRLTAGSIG